jgi:hypothetical protein
MNPQDRLNAQVTAWALLPVISPLLVRGKADYFEGGILAARAHPDLQKFIASSDDSPETQDEAQGEQHSIIPSPPPPPKISLPPKPKKGGGLFQLDTATAARSRTLPEIERSAVASPAPISVESLPDTAEGTPEGTHWNILMDASPSPPPAFAYHR